MPDAEATPLLTQVITALNGEDPDSALREALAALAKLGIVPRHPRATATPWLRVEHGGRVLELDTTHSRLCAADRELLRHALALGLRRVVEREAFVRVNERMELLSAASFEGLFFHVDGVIVDANQRMTELLGYSREELLGDQTLRRCVAPEDLPGVLKRMAERYEGDYVIDGVRKDGSRFRAELQAKQGHIGDRPVRVAAVRDVTERERTQALLRESEARLRTLAQTAFDATVYSREGVVVDVMGNLEGLLGYRPEEMIGQPLCAFATPEDAAHVAAVVADQRTGAYQFRGRSKSGEEVPVEVVAVYATLDGKPVRMGALRDLRPTRRLEQQRRELEQQLERSQRLESLGVLAGGIAHDFNNLLTAVLGNAELLESRLQDTRERQNVRHIIDAAQRAASLTAQMLAYAGRKELGPRAAVDLSSLVQELRVLLDATLSKKAHVGLSLAGDSVVLGNRATLTQVVMNLLTNASDALGDGAGTIEVCTRVERDPAARYPRALGAELKRGEFVLLQVRDSGAGMDQSTAARIFEPFFTTKSRGHGLGLAACIGIVTSHGGAIAVDSAPGRGSTFSVLLPAHRERVRAQPAPRSARGAGDETILVVDDEEMLRAHLRRALSRQGYRVLEAGSGRAALHALERERPALVVLDVTMPDLSGIEVLRELRARGSSVPVVLCSGYHDAALDLEPAAYQGFLVKPYTLNELCDAVQNALCSG